MLRIQKRALPDLVYEKLRVMIDDGALPAASKVDKVTLAERLGVSLTPVNDALSRLTGEKLLEKRSRQGFFVRSYTYAELAPLYELRAALESMAVRLGLERGGTTGREAISHAFDGFLEPLGVDRWPEYHQADRRFHQSIIEFSGNPFLVDMAWTSALLTRSNMRGLIRSPSQTLAEHRSIIAAIEHGDPLRAQEEMVQHLLRTRDLLKTMHD